MSEENHLDRELLREQAYAYAGHDDAMDYLYDFLDDDLAARLEEEWALLPEGMGDLLASHSLEDYVWLWLKDPGVNGFRAYLSEGGFPEDITAAVYGARIQGWAIDNPPHVAWLREDGYEPPVNPHL